MTTLTLFPYIGVLPRQLFTIDEYCDTQFTFNGLLKYQYFDCDCDCDYDWFIKVFL